MKITASFILKVISAILLFVSIIFLAIYLQCKSDIVSTSHICLALISCCAISFVSAKLIELIKKNILDMKVNKKDETVTDMLDEISLEVNSKTESHKKNKRKNKKATKEDTSVDDENDLSSDKNEE